MYILNIQDIKPVYWYSEDSAQCIEVEHRLALIGRKKTGNYTVISEMKMQFPISFLLISNFFSTFALIVCNVFIVASLLSDIYLLSVSDDALNRYHQKNAYWFQRPP